ncbi:hypothetical protein HYT57_00060 [Candidatus Woesearchaeota archaeon]|nr:hypothetical protein [Candidatus Woesearchaeota archaeon]
MGEFKRLDKTVLKITGDVRKLILDISTNEAINGKNALIDRFGKLVVLFDQIFIESYVYTVFDKQFNQRFYEYTSNLIKLSGCNVEFSKLNVFHVFSDEEHFSVSPENEFGGIKIPQRIGHLLLSEKTPNLNELDDEEYMQTLVENNISRQGIDFDREMLLNLNWQEVVSFTKGCYIGQEIMARVHNLGKPPLKLIRLLNNNPLKKINLEGKDINITSECYSEKYKGYIGFALIPNKEFKDLRII